MAAVTGAVIGGLALANNIYQGQQNRNAANNAAKSSQNVANAALQATQQNYQQTQGNLTPYINAGQGALSNLAALNNGNYSGFENSPDYLYALQQATQGEDRSAAARGSLYSGGHDVDLAKAISGIASQNLGNYRNSLITQASMGQGAATNLGSIGAGAAGQIGNVGFTNAANQTNAGYNAAAGNINTANNTGSILGQLWGQYGNSIMPNTTAVNQSSYGITPMQNSFNTGNYTGPGSLSTNVTVPNYLTGA